MPNSPSSAHREPRRIWAHLPWACAVIAALALLSYFLLAPFLEAADKIAAMQPKDTELAGKMLLYKSELVLKVAGLVSGVIGTVIVVIGAWATVSKLGLDRESMAATRLSTASTQLGSMAGDEPNIDGRLGGVYGIEALASLPRLYWPAMELLTNYVRAACARQPVAPSRNGNALRPDVRAALRVIGRSEPNDQQPGPRPGDLKDLRHANLRGAELWGYGLDKADFSRSDLTNAHMEGGSFNRAKFEETILVGAFIGNAAFEGASFVRADVSGCDFSKAQKMTKAQLGDVARRDGTIDPPG